MNENRWSPFDPKWYQSAFDKFIYTADELFNSDLILKEGYSLPDSDGSKSSVFRNNSVLNNSFNEKQLRETLKDIYLNSSYKLIANNHDNTHFFQWAGKLSDLTISENTHTMEFVIPVDPFIYPKERDKYKLSQFYRKWIKVEDIMNNWEIFKWCCLVFLDQKVFSDYELRIDDHQVMIRFEYYDYWLKADYPIYIYKFDTNSSCRIKISKFLCNDTWNWKLPVSYITDKRILNSTNVVVAFNKIKDERSDGLTNIEVIGDNLEFLKIEDGFIDLSNISNFNKSYINSESSEWLWMSIFVPKFFHEYPILLPVDSIYRPYEGNFEPVTVVKNEVVNHVKVEYNDEIKQVYVDLNDNSDEEFDGWKQMIRPIVLADAFDNCEEPYESLILEINNLRDLTVKGANIIEEFRFFLYDYTDELEEKFYQYLEDILNIMYSIREAHNNFLNRLCIEYNEVYENQYKKFQKIMGKIKSDGRYSDYLSNYDETEESEDDFFFMVSPLIYIPRELADKYYIINIINDLSDHNKHLWDDINEYLGKIRFQRPIDENDFWTFEYDPENCVWRPYPLKITRHFPDVYLPEDESENIPRLNRLFKAFFFYSDTIGIRELSSDIIRATPSWDDDVKEYHFDQEGIYRDIFMEKFYWMGVRSIYRGILSTHNRWEAIEYIIDNPSYDRFNELFLHTIDPYFKLGLATYLKSSNFEFPFDDAISKIEEAINTNWLGYKKITNFEMYLNKTWIPSYFDYITRIMDDWDWSNKLLRRPRSTFDTTRIIPILISIQESIFETINELRELIDWILAKLAIEDYRLSIKNFEDLKLLIDEIYENIKSTLEYTENLDLDIFSIDDINHIISKLRKHNDLTNNLRVAFNVIYEDANNHNVYEEKRSLLNHIIEYVNNIPDHITALTSIVQNFDMEEFMKSVNELRTYFIYNKENPNDNSLLGHVNEFNDPWSTDVKNHRNKLFQSTSILYGTFEPSKSYDKKEVEEFVLSVNTVKEDMINFKNSIEKYYTHFGYEVDQIVIDRLDNGLDRIDELKINIDNYMNAREKFLADYDKIKELILLFDQYNIGKTEITYRTNILEFLDNVLSSLSYIAGENKKEEAIESFNSISKEIDIWSEFINIEEEVFVNIYKLSKPPVNFMEILEKNQSIIDAIIEYMDTVNTEYVPDSSWATYSDIYEVEEVELISGGFNNKIGEMIFIPNLGTYKITEINEEVSKAINIEDSGYRKTSFRNPLTQSNPYDSITDGIGLGITVKPISVKHELIMNDEVIKQIIVKVQNGIYLLSKDILTYNPRSNNIFESDLKFIENIKISWDEIIDIYSDYMSNEIKSYGNDLVNLIYSSIEPSKVFMGFREGINADKLIKSFDDYITSCYKYAGDINSRDDYFFYCDNILRNAYNLLFDFYSGGTGWSDGIEFRQLLTTIEYPISFYKNKILSNWEKNESVEKLLNLHYDIIKQISDIRTAISFTTDSIVDITPIIKQTESKLEEMPIIQKDVWYKIKYSKVATEGTGYKIGDIVEIIPKLPTDQYGNDIHGMDDIILNDTILMQITAVEDGSVTEIKPLMNYALPYLIWGIRETKTRVGSGNGLIVDIYSYEIELSDSVLFNNSKSDVSVLPQFDENDMFMFKFENIHDLDINYEVFLGGKQITNFFQRHESVNNPLHPKNIDVLYLNANEVMGLRNSSIYIAAENYFIYKIDDIEIKDPGAGYCVGQDIFVDTSTMALRLTVAKLIYGPYKGIAELDVKGTITSKDFDPSSKDCEVVTDSLNNIDDEYNIGYYDRITSKGIKKKATLSLDGDEYTFTAKRFDNMDGDDRNSTFMYPDVDIPLVEDAAKNGDPDSHWYQGSRIDNSQHPMEDERRWNGIMNLNPPTDPFIPDDRRMPLGKPIKGEYQRILKQRIHDSTGVDIDLSSMIPLTVPEEEAMWYDNTLPEDGLLVIKQLSEITNPETYKMWNKEGNPEETNEHFNNFNPITEYEVTNMWYNNIIPSEEDDSIGFTVINSAMIEGDLSVPTYADLPKHRGDYPDGAVGKSIIVECDETHGGHRMLYKIRTFIISGFFIYDLPEVADYKWNIIDVNWMDTDYYPDYPSIKAQYPTEKWRTSKYFKNIQQDITDGKIEDKFPDIYKNSTTYIHNLTVDDLSVFNWTTKKWENLHDTSRWKLEVRNDDENKNWGFTLTFLLEGSYSYDMRLYLNKIPETQMRNAKLKRNAKVDIIASILSEVNKKAINSSVNTGRHLRIRKLFPYEQKESYTIGYNEDGSFIGYEMNFKLANYIHYKNEIHLEDVKVYNKTAGRFENLLDTSMYEVRFKDPKAINRGYEIQTKIIQSLIGKAGTGFVDGDVWAWNAEYGIHVFGRVTADYSVDGHIITFDPVHCPNPPKEDISLEFNVFQHSSQSEVEMAVVLIEFKTERLEVFGDGYIHNVTNRLAPIPNEFKIIVKYDLTGPQEYDIIISKTPRKWTFIEPEWLMSPTFHIDDYNIQYDRLYVLTENGRFPMVNPSTGKPTLHVVEKENGTDVTFLNLYRRYEHLQICSVPYPMRSVYVQRKIPSNGFIDLTGKINKPLNKKYFEFWVNGKLMYDEVTIISPTKIFLHGLTSLKNLEIIEINRDSNEYFSDCYLEISDENGLKRPHPEWNYKTYLDDALEGNLNGDNYTSEEQEYLLSPVWPQVDETHPEFKNYPPNVDIDDDVLLRTNPEDYPINELENPLYQFLVTNQPTLEGKPLVEQTLSFRHFGLIPISEEMIIDMLNEEWKEEIANNSYLQDHAILTDAEWYGMTARLYDEYGILVHTLNESVYHVADTNLLKINTSSKLSRIVRNAITYDLT